MRSVFSSKRVASAARIEGCGLSHSGVVGPTVVEHQKMYAARVGVHDPIYELWVCSQLVCLDVYEVNQEAK